MKCQECSCGDHRGARFCERCGHPVPVVCPACGQEVSRTARFCGRCGSALPEPAGTADDGPVAGSLATVPERFTAHRPATPLVPQGRVQAADDEIQGERKPVTIMFADIVGSTALAERLDPEEWREILVGAHRLVGEAVHRYEGTIAQLLGDGVLAFFGAPATHEDDPLRAVRAGLDLQESIEAYAATLAPSIPALRMRVGIDTGTVVVGQIVHEQQVEYTATGDALNRAARLQAAAAPGAVLVSDAIFQAVRHAVIAVDLGPIAIKGSEWPPRVHEVHGLDAAGRGGRPAASTKAALVGRVDELQALVALTAAVRAGAGRVAVVIGEPGAGKSRLIDEWRRDAGPGIAGSRPSAFRSARASHITSSSRSSGHSWASPRPRPKATRRPQSPP